MEQAATILGQLSRNKLYSIYQFLLLESRSPQELPRNSSKAQMIDILCRTLTLDEIQYCVDFFDNYDYYQVPPLKAEMISSLPEDLLVALFSIYLDDDEMPEGRAEFVERLTTSQFFLKEDARKFYLWFHYFRERVAIEQAEDNLEQTSAFSAKEMMIDVHAVAEQPLTEEPSRWTGESSTYVQPVSAQELGQENVTSASYQGAASQEQALPHNPVSSFGLGPSQTSGGIQDRSAMHTIQMDAGELRSFLENKDAIYQNLTNTAPQADTTGAVFDPSATRPPSSDSFPAGLGTSTVLDEQIQFQSTPVAPSSSRLPNVPFPAPPADVIPPPASGQNFPAAPEAFEDVPTSVFQVPVFPSAAENMQVRPTVETAQPIPIAPASAPAGTRSPGISLGPAGGMQSAVSGPSRTIEIEAFDLDSYIVENEAGEKDIDATLAKLRAKDASLVDASNKSASSQELESPTSQSLPASSVIASGDEIQELGLEEVVEDVDEEIQELGPESELEDVEELEAAEELVEELSELDVADSYHGSVPAGLDEIVNDDTADSGVSTHQSLPQSPPSRPPHEARPSREPSQARPSIPRSPSTQNGRVGPNIPRSATIPQNTNPVLPRAASSAARPGVPNKKVLSPKQIDVMASLLYKVSLLGASYARPQIRAIRLFFQKDLECGPRQLRKVRDVLKKCQSQDFPLTAPSLKELAEFGHSMPYAVRSSLIHTVLFLIGCKRVQNLDRYREFLRELSIDLRIDPDDVSLFSMFGINAEEVELDAFECLELFGLELGATEDEIRKAHRDMVKRYHPDQFHARGPEFVRLAERKMKEMNKALEILLHREKRNL